jgi:hypothetical protein
MPSHRGLSGRPAMSVIFVSGEVTRVTASWPVDPAPLGRKDWHYAIAPQELREPRDCLEQARLTRQRVGQAAIVSE